MQKMYVAYLARKDFPLDQHQATKQGLAPPG